MNKPSTLTTIFGQFALLLLGVVAAALLAEAALRFWPPDSIASKQIGVMDSVLNHALRPAMSVTVNSSEYRYELRTNDQGFRDADFGSIPGGVVKIAMLGDSFVEGVGVSEESTFVRRAERALAVDLGRPVRCMNFGVAGYSPIIEYLQLVTKVLSYKPTMVIVNFDLSDLVDDSLYACIGEFSQNGRPLRIYPVYPLGAGLGMRPLWPLKSFVQQHSYLWSYLRILSENMPYLKSNAHLAAYTPLFAYTLDSSGRLSEGAFHRSERYLALMADTLQSNAIPLLLTIHPMGHQVGPLEWTVGRKECGLPAGIVRSRMLDNLRDFARAQNIPYLDMTRALQAESRGDLYFAQDAHWTARGHKVAADTLVSFLLSRFPGALVP